MADKNLTIVEEFILLGFSELQNFQSFLFVIFLVIYISILLGNGFIVVITNMERTLQTPMYYFLGNFSFVEICYTSVTLPRMLMNLWRQKRNISLLSCAIQLCFFLILGVTESFLLAVMAYDRYVAICKPLYYPLIMNHKMCVQMVIGSWVTGIPVLIGQTYQVFSVPFCGSNKLNHVFCDMPPLMKLACGDTSGDEFFIYIDCFLFGFIPFLLILLSYIRILNTILKLPTTTGRSKAFSTCSSHLIVICVFYGSGFITYLQSKSNYSDKTEKIFSLFYTIVTPVFNPMIYSLRNKDFTEAVRKIFCKSHLEYAESLQISSSKHPLKILKNNSMHNESSNQSPENIRFLPPCEPGTPEAADTGALEAASGISCCCYRHCCMISSTTRDGSQTALNLIPQFTPTCSSVFEG
ncbi:olfactory receptor 10AG1-like [Trichosurus vulpecula]|uniref:olfactory receptor 10AG1-like n=1 Tax=Trichosurus vulpecula TaxID=9337 RepID=UPI00186B0D8F|nr:olfactory receptor 10AG1-like [Trichosurus vulpecula]